MFRGFNGMSPACEVGDRVRSFGSLCQVNFSVRKIAVLITAGLAPASEFARKTKHCTDFAYVRGAAKLIGVSQSN